MQAAGQGITEFPNETQKEYLPEQSQVDAVQLSNIPPFQYSISLAFHHSIIPPFQSPRWFCQPSACA